MTLQERSPSFSLRSDSTADRPALWNASLVALRPFIAFAHVDLIPDEAQLLRRRAPIETQQAYQALRSAAGQEQDPVPGLSGPPPLGVYLDLTDEKTWDAFVQYSPVSINVDVWSAEDRGLLRQGSRHGGPPPRPLLDQTDQLDRIGLSLGPERRAVLERALADLQVAFTLQEE